MTEQSSRFRFTKSPHVPALTVLQAAMHDFSYDRHAHEEYAFGVTLAGRQDFFSGGEFHRSPPGNVILFNPEEVHDGQPGGGETLDYVMVYAHPRQLEALFADALGHEAATDFRINETLIQDPVLRRDILELVRLVTTQVGSCIDQENALYRLIARSVQLAGALQPNHVASRPDTLLGFAREYIHSHLSEDVSLDDISQAAHLSKYHFLRLFRRQFGMTPHQYVINCRVNAARAALDAGTSLNEVAFQYGFADLSHFNRRFKRIYGMTPRQYQSHITT
ncbi:helix-turn-helix transcriptional regulator [Aidingimonas halophila]|uniref:Transcriptional regulator, AraC family n=1 Tax=Aidingimonas halophila TaxID=574349 RepID=A0A1H3GQ86_9GAMM|nr:AraC family transcriptional regulator [Aidingimonas halophila]GHC35776.1 AraC family transcriptional regulator [Aidingimonas halophila]SDY05482.1 transcriptional regulator, AraC family [Aidingimonas halophila]